MNHLPSAWPTSQTAAGKPARSQLMQSSTAIMVSGDRVAACRWCVVIVVMLELSRLRSDIDFHSCYASYVTSLPAVICTPQSYAAPHQSEELYLPSTPDSHTDSLLPSDEQGSQGRYPNMAKTSNNKTHTITSRLSEATQQKGSAPISRQTSQGQPPTSCSRC